MKLRKDEKGQGMVEYGIIIALVAIVAIAAMTTLGQSLTTRFTDVAGSIAGLPGDGGGGADEVAAE